MNWRRALAVGAALVVVVVSAGVVLSRPAPRLVSTNAHIVVSGLALPLDAGKDLCANDILVPADASSVRVYEAPYGGSGPPLQLSVFRGDATVINSAAPGGYSPGTLELHLPQPHAGVDNARVCLHNAGTNGVSVAANSTPYRSVNIKPTTPDEIRVDLFRSGRRSWLDSAPSIARRFALFKPSFAGPWFFWVVVAAFVLVVAGAVLLLLTESRSTMRRAVACGVVAFTMAGLWSVVTPPLQVPDEGVHIGYTSYLAKTGSIPRPDLPEPRGAQTIYGGELETLWLGMPFSLEGKPSWSPHDVRALRAKLAQDRGEVVESGGGSAATYPPLYYGYEATFARVGARLDLLDRIYLLRMGSALLAALTVVFVFLFVREVMPATPWAWTVGALVVAFQPLFGFIGGGVNNDNMLYATSAGLFFALARCFRSGLTVRRGLGVGAALAAGLLTKPTTFGLIPGVGVGMALIAWRQRRALDAAVRSLAAAVGAVVLAVGAWAVYATAALGRAGAFGQERVGGGGTLVGQASYLWQFYLPALPFMRDVFKGLPVWTVYGESFVGRFGWAEFGFVPWVYQLALGVLAGIAALVVIDVVRERAVLRRRWEELLTYGVLAVGVPVLVGVIGYRYRASHGFLFEQMRYLLPILPLYALLIVMAARAFGRRWAAIAGSVLVVMAAGHALFALLVTLNRYYA